MSGSKLIVLVLACGALLSDLRAAGPNWMPGYRYRMSLEVVGDEKVWTSGSQWIVASVPTGGWCQPGGLDLQVQSSTSSQAVLTQVLSFDPNGNALIQFQQDGQNRNFCVYLGGPMARATAATVGQALTLEVRPFQGASLDSWADVLKELQLKPQILGNAFAAQILHWGNPFRPGQLGNFAAIYRGFLKIDNADTYLFASNSDDASFLFVNQQLVYSQTGKRTALGRSVTDWHEMTLQPGLIPIEYYHFTSPGCRTGIGSLVWKKTNQKMWEAIPEKYYLQAPLAEVTGIEGLGIPAAAFSSGIEDALISQNATAYLVRFQAQGTYANPNDLHWTFGDGSTATGASVQHVYFDKGEYPVTLQVANYTPFRQTIFVYEPPVNSSPHSLQDIVHVLEGMNLTNWNSIQVSRAFDFIMASDQPGRWKLQQALAQNLLANKDLDGARRMLLYDALLEAMAQQGQAEEGVKLQDQIFAEAGHSSSLRLQASRTIARIQWKYLRHFKEASDLYQKIIDEDRRVRLPELRRAAIEWGDMYLEAGDMANAEQQYHLASTLGGDDYASTGQMQAIQRGAMLRVAEQQLKAGNNHQSRALLDKIEIEQPEQKLEGLFRFLRAEVDRQAGRYPEAIENYEVLLKLTQWAGYRDRALGGIAQCYLHQGELKKARDIFDAIKKSYPDYYAEQKFDQMVFAAQNQAGPTPTPAGMTKEAALAASGEFTLSLDPAQLTATLQNLTSMDGFGIRGNHVLEACSPVPLDAQLKQSVDNLQPGAHYWVEFWYRTQRALIIPGGITSLYVTLLPRDQVWAANPLQRIALDRTFGAWRKVGMLVDSATLPQMDLELRMSNLTGSFQWDGLRALRVEDREIDALANFLQDDSPQ